MDYEGSLPHSQEPPTDLSIEPDESTSYLLTLFLWDPILPFKPKSSAWSLPFSFSDQNYVCINAIQGKYFIFLRSVISLMWLAMQHH